MSSQYPPRDTPHEDEFPLYDPTPSGPGAPSDHPGPPSGITPAPMSTAATTGSVSRRGLMTGVGAAAVGAALVSGALLRTNRSSEAALSIPAQAEQFEVTLTSGSVTLRRASGEATATWKGRRNEEPDVSTAGAVTTIAGTSADLALDVPVGTDIQIRTSSGDIRIENASIQDLALRSSSGDIRIEAGTVENLTVQTTSGDFRVEDGAVVTLTSESTSGDVGLELVGTPQEVSVATTSGDVEIRLPGRAYRYETDTRSGDVSIPGNSGAVPITVRTSSGDIDIEED